MQTAVENPMVVGPYYDDRPPACTCPHCGETWHAYLDRNFSTVMFEGSSIATWHPLSDTGKYCAACIVDAFGSDQALLDWFDQEADPRDFITFFLGQQPHGGDKPGEEESELVVKLIREHEPDSLAEALSRWVLGSTTSREYEAYEAWLMEHK